MKLENKMLAVIMIGGQSKRLGGGIKSFIEFNERKIFDRIFEKTRLQIDQIIINCNSEEVKLNEYKIPIIKDLKIGYAGPLAGIHSAMNWINTNKPQIEWLVTIPGDTPFIPDDLIDNFKKKISPKSKIILAQSQNRTHPIIGVWHTSLFKSLDIKLDEGVRKIMSWASLHPIEYINYPIKKFDPFFNINTIEDINTAIEIEKIIIEKN